MIIVFRNYSDECVLAVYKNNPENKFLIKTDILSLVLDLCEIVRAKTTMYFSEIQTNFS